jgi:hypothetical protein
MKRSLLAVALLSVASLSYAQSVNRAATLNWQAPTQCTDNSAISNCAVTGYIIEKQSGTNWNAIGETAANVLTFQEQNLALGLHSRQ